jgi:triacylglycerol lipase
VILSIRPEFQIKERFIMNIVLAHGILGFRTLHGIDYFKGVKEHLEKDNKIKVLVTQVSPIKGVFDRGDDLSKQITDALDAGLPGGLDPLEKTHIIAHSMGGLDSRYILSPHNTTTNIAKRITSLTTIGTPHNGSPVGDLIDGKDPLIDLPKLKALGDKIHDAISNLVVSLDGLDNLTSEWCNGFNQDYVEHPEVRYFSVAGVGRKFRVMKLFRFFAAPTCQILLATHEYLKLKTGEENDGAVTVSSAQRYELITEAWPTDHFEEVGHDLNRLPPKDQTSFDYLAKYTEIANRLSQI